MAAGEVNEKVSLIREHNGVRLEQVEVWGADGLSDTFLRLLVGNPAHPAAGIANTLMNIPEQATGFRCEPMPPASDLLPGILAGQSTHSATCPRKTPLSRPFPSNENRRLQRLGDSYAANPMIPCSCDFRRG